MAIAPVILFVYRRPSHTEKTVESLKQNSLASESILYVYSDGPKNNIEYENVKEVRNYIRSIKGFKEIIINDREHHLGLADSIIDGVTNVINYYGKAIIMEDDLVSAPNFLQYMNDALEYYEENPKIFSVTGYSYPVKMPVGYREQIYCLPRASSWGWGTWLDRWTKADWEIKNFKEFITNKKIQRLFNRAGEDYSPMLKAQMLGYIDSWGIRWAYTHYKNGGYCLYPVRSKILNIGADASGTHYKRNTKKYNVKVDQISERIVFKNDIEIQWEIMRRVNNLVKPSIIRKIINRFKYKSSKFNI